MQPDTHIIYQLQIADIQTVSIEELGRKLTADELTAVESRVGEYIDWRTAIASALHEQGIG